MVERGEIVKVVGMGKAKMTGELRAIHGWADVVLYEGVCITVPLKNVEKIDKPEDAEAGPMLIGLLLAALSGAFSASLFWWFIGWS